MPLTKADIDKLVEVLPGYPDGPVLIGKLLDGATWVDREELRKALYAAVDFWATPAEEEP